MPTLDSTLSDDLSDLDSHAPRGLIPFGPAAPPPPPASTFSQPRRQATLLPSPTPPGSMLRVPGRALRHLGCPSQLGISRRAYRLRGDANLQ
jgi:hypothetical protein